MQYLLMLYADESGWSRLTPAEQEQGMAAYKAYTEALAKAGALQGSNRLQPVATATTVRVSDGKSHVLDGPYAETKEQLGGILLLEAKDLNHAIQLMSKHPGVRLGGPFEIRPAAPEINEASSARGPSGKQ